MDARVKPAHDRCASGGHEARETLDDSANLARALGVNGAPSHVISENVVLGAVGIAALSDKSARK